MDAEQTFGAMRPALEEIAARWEHRVDGALACVFAAAWTALHIGLPAAVADPGAYVASLALRALAREEQDERERPDNVSLAALAADGWEPECVEQDPDRLVPSEEDFHLTIHLLREARLTVRELYAVVRHFGILGEPRYTFAESADALGISPSTIRRSYRAGMQKIRTAATAADTFTRAA